MRLDEPPRAQCEHCIFRLNGGRTCVAFTRGLPAEIANGTFDHRYPHPADGGFRFAFGATGGGPRQPRASAKPDDSADRVRSS